MARRSGSSSPGKRGKREAGPRHAKKKGCLAKAVAVVVPLAVAILCAGSAGAATGPFFVRAQHSPVCIKVSPDQPGTHAVQGDYHAGDCRKLFFDQLGHVNGFAYGQWMTTGKHALAAPTCGVVDLEASHGTGTSWVTYLAATGQTYLVNKRCDEKDGSNCLIVIAATGQPGDTWSVLDRRIPGFFTNMRIVPLASSHPQVRAGC